MKINIFIGLFIILVSNFTAEKGDIKSCLQEGQNPSPCLAFGTGIRSLKDKVYWGQLGIDSKILKYLTQIKPTKILKNMIVIFF